MDVCGWYILYRVRWVDMTCGCEWCGYGLIGGIGRGRVRVGWLVWVVYVEEVYVVG